MLYIDLELVVVLTELAVTLIELTVVLIELTVVSDVGSKLIDVLIVLDVVLVIELKFDYWVVRLICVLGRDITGSITCYISILSTEHPLGATILT